MSVPLGLQMSYWDCTIGTWLSNCSRSTFATCAHIAGYLLPSRSDAQSASLLVGTTLSLKVQILQTVSSREKIYPNQASSGLRISKVLTSSLASSVSMGCLLTCLMAHGNLHRNQRQKLGASLSRKTVSMKALLSLLAELLMRSNLSSEPRSNRIIHDVPVGLVNLRNLSNIRFFRNLSMPQLGEESMCLPPWCVSVLE